MSTGVPLLSFMPRFRFHTGFIWETSAVDGSLRPSAPKTKKITPEPFQKDGRYIILFKGVL